MLLLNFITSISLVTLSGLLSLGTSTFIWSPTNEWTPCSKSCDKGEETQSFVCLKRTNYRTLEYVKSPKCRLDKYPIKTRPCSFGKCPHNSTGTFVWQVGNWSSCQKNCGGDGTQVREVNCNMMTSKGQYLLSKLSKCDNKLEPPRFISCGHADCPPKFLTSKWHKCSESSDCRPSIRRREVKCVTLNRDGKIKIQSPGVCYRMKERPPSSWMVCHSKINQHCLDMKKENKKQNSKIEIKTDNSEIHQMRHTKRLKVLVGQTAYVLGFTRLSIFCPMPMMHRSKIKWQHGNDSYEYYGTSRERIRVNRKGVLVIREFYLIDSGEWICKAGKYTAKAALHLEQPSTGFDNWLKRHANHNYGMLNEESNFSFIRPESIMWIKSDWSPCSATCKVNSSSTGYQTRKVTCEKIEAQYYKIIEDKYCPPLKPISIKKCKSYEKCPKWVIEKNENEQCSDVCIDIGVARTNTNIVCQFNNKTVDSSLCDHQKLPNITCHNDKCQISYKYGPWSQCSLSCSNTTSASIRSRTMKCIWKHTNKPAYSLCQLQQLPNRSLTKPCRVPKCILGCKDLTPACGKQSKYRCRSSLFNHFCCAFCNKQFS